MLMLQRWHLKWSRSQSEEKTTQHTYSAERRASIGKYASLHGQAAAVKHFTGICGYVVPESTVRKFRDAYYADLKAQSSANSGPVSVLIYPVSLRGGRCC